MLEHNDLDAALQVDVEKLRAEYPRTLDLYREVCVVMFFRYGITPTANKLYQLVRKGSMSAPTEALRAFWADLRRSANPTCLTIWHRLPAISYRSSGTRLRPRRTGLSKSFG